MFGFAIAQIEAEETQPTLKVIRSMARTLSVVGIKRRIQTRLDRP